MFTQSRHVSNVVFLVMFVALSCCLNGCPAATITNVYYPDTLPLANSIYVPPGTYFAELLLVGAGGDGGRVADGETAYSGASGGAGGGIHIYIHNPIANTILAYGIVVGARYNGAVGGPGGESHMFINTPPIGGSPHQVFVRAFGGTNPGPTPGSPFLAEEGGAGGNAFTQDLTVVRVVGAAGGTINNPAFAGTACYKGGDGQISWGNYWYAYPGGAVAMELSARGGQQGAGGAYRSYAYPSTSCDAGSPYHAPGYLNQDGTSYNGTVSYPSSCTGILGGAGGPAAVPEVSTLSVGGDAASSFIGSPPYPARDGLNGGGGAGNAGIDNGCLNQIATSPGGHFWTNDPGHGGNGFLFVRFETL